MFRQLLLTAFLIAPLKAQIYADFTVSSGETSLGTFRVLLEHTKAPRTCANFIGLASGKRPWVDVTTGAVRTNTPYYKGLTFHRLIHSFVIQGGSPNGQGTDGPGYSILDEYHPDLDHSEQYVLSMAKGGAPNTGGSQFFITLRNTQELDNKHSVFGTVITGTEIIESFKNSSNFPTGANNKPTTSIVMDSVVISGEDYETFDIDAPALRLPHVSGTEMRITRDTALATMTAHFDRKPQTEYFFLGSPGLATWSSPKRILSLDSENDFADTFESRTETQYFLNMASVDYSQIPNAPTDLNTAGNTVRILFSDGTSLDISPDGTGGGTWVDANGSGNISSVSWSDQAATTGTISHQFSQAYRLSIGDFRVTLLEYPSPGSSIRLETWLSFHTATTGWIEELGSTGGNRFEFEILSN